MLEKAVRICDATFGNLFRFDGNTYYLAAGVGTPLELAEFQRQHRSGPFQPDPGSQLKLVMRTKRLAISPTLPLKHPPAGGQLSAARELTSLSP